MPGTWDEFDVATGQWLEHIVAEGYPKGYASDGLAALQHSVPEVAGKLRHSWRLLKSWQKMEPPVRVLPISPLMAVAISGACAKLGQVSAASAFLLPFDTFLRPGELYRLIKQDITWAGSVAVLSLKKTKSGQRRNVTEMVEYATHASQTFGCGKLFSTKSFKIFCWMKLRHNFAHSSFTFWNIWKCQGISPCIALGVVAPRGISCHKTI